MTEREYYERLLKKMKSAVINLTNSMQEIDSLINKLNQGLSLNEEGYKTQDLKKIKNQLEEYCNKINKTIIPAIEQELEENVN